MGRHLTDDERARAELEAQLTEAVTAFVDAHNAEVSALVEDTVAGWDPALAGDVRLAPEFVWSLFPAVTGRAASRVLFGRVLFGRDSPSSHDGIDDRVPWHGPPRRFTAGTDLPPRPDPAAGDDHAGDDAVFGVIMNERPPHHASDGRFRNPWPDRAPHAARDLARLMWAQFSRRVPTARHGSFPTATPAFVYPRAGSDVATATWMGHSTTLLQVGGLNILTDPMWGENAFPVQGMGPRRVMPPPIAFEALPPIDIVLQSHNHYDHLDSGTVRRIAAMHPRATWVAPLKLGATLRRFGVREVVELDWWQETDVRGIGITATPACHFSGRGPFDRNRTLWCGFALRAGARRAWFAADTAYHPEFGLVGERCGPFDLVIMPIGAYDPRWFMRIVHVDPDEAVQAYRDACAAWSSAPAPTMLAIHWGTFRLTTEPMGEPPLRARAAWERVGLPVDALWIAAFGETRAW